jgi:acyl-CoA thioester hydrolase
MTADPDLPTAGRLDGGTHRLALRIYYEDTDFSGLVYHASYLRFLERGRTEFIRALGIDQRRLHAETGLAFVVSRMSLAFLRPAVMDDIVTVETVAASARGAALVLRQRLMRGGNALLEAEVTVVPVKDGRPQRLPAPIRAAFLAESRDSQPS